MKAVIFSILFVLFTMAASSAANIQQDQTTEGTTSEEAEQVITVCSLLTEFEEKVRECVEIKNGQNCGIGLGFKRPVPEDVGDIIKAFFTNVLASCDEDLPCILKEAVSAKAEHCAASN